MHILRPVDPAVVAGPVERRRGILHQIGGEAQVARHARSGGDAVIALETGEDQSSDPGVAQPSL